MKLKFIVVTLFSLFLAMQGYAQNSYDKAEVMESVKNLNDYTQSWIDTNFSRLTNTQIGNFINRSTITGLEKKYSSAMNQLKGKATSNEIEGFYKSPSESALQALFTKHNISF